MNLAPSGEATSGDAFTADGLREVATGHFSWSSRVRLPVLARAEVMAAAVSAVGWQPCGRPPAQRQPISQRIDAVNADLAESNLAVADLQEGWCPRSPAAPPTTATVGGPAPAPARGPGAPAADVVVPPIGGMRFLATETVLSNRLSRRALDPDA